MRPLAIICAVPLLLLASGLTVAGCDDDEDSEAQSSSEEAAAEQQVVTEKGEVTVATEGEPPQVGKKGYSHLSEAEPPEIESSLMAALDESLDERQAFSSQAEADIASAYKFSLEYCQQLVNSIGSGTSWTYSCAVPPAECVSLNATVARCTIEIRTQELGSGHGGVDRWLRRQYLQATRVGDNIYNTSFGFFDFTGGQAICSDANLPPDPALFAERAVVSRVNA